ncbi:MAG: response regulator transcription factor [Bryobacter sp.]|nr:response regulator transcription factor [Bryobacter sp.]
MRLLLVEDEPEAAQVLAKGLREHTYAVDIASTGPEALEKCWSTPYDLVLLDVMLPGLSGLEVCRRLRAAAFTAPVLMLTALDQVENRIAGLDCGADDYLPKPFDFGELLARVRALLRRGPALRAHVLRIDDLEIDTRARRVSRAGRPVELTAKEYALLEFLAHRQGEVVGRAEISEHVWDESYDPFSNLIEVYVQRLRRKLEPPGARRLLHTRRGEGYQLVVGGDALD